MLESEINAILISSLEKLVSEEIFSSAAASTQTFSNTTVDLNFDTLKEVLKTIKQIDHIEKVYLSPDLYKTHSIIQPRIPIAFGGAEVHENKLLEDGAIIEYKSGKVEYFNFSTNKAFEFNNKNIFPKLPMNWFENINKEER